MSSGELFLTLLVTLIVLGPNKLPMLAEHLGKFLRFCNRLKEQAILLWQSELQRQQLEENKRKAEKADALYQQEKQNNKS